ncbi:hypothetical protein SKAU_G00386470 [Synaphobranchus kaupii]|uniref:Uncharacterized protein n=1 Tax=Synaphobranchus kaupii TaxID=118154 RepID=A0A9Q1IF49_SYNKA|nr:hypothetical protein SKAU_G00386470 [Synaphobranchus kaupii]
MMQEQLHCSDDTLKQWVGHVKQWASSGNTVATSGDVLGLQSSIETLFVSICQKKHYLYRQNDRNKRRQKISYKISQLKKRLLQEIERYNQLSIDTLDINSVVQKLSSKAAESMIWPWQEENTDGVHILTKKKIFDQQMLLSRLGEERHILLKEMMQHCVYINDSLKKVQSLMVTISENTQTGSSMTGFSEEGSKGLICLLKGRIQDLRLEKQAVASCYRTILHSEPSPWLGGEEEGEIEEEERNWQHESSSDCEDDTDDDDDDDDDVQV